MDENDRPSGTVYYCDWVYCLVTKCLPRQLLRHPRVVVSKSVFSKIVDGELPSHRLFEDEQCIVILSIDPIAPGHSLVIPKQQSDYLWQTDDELYQHLWIVAKRIALALQKTFKTERVISIVEGEEVKHTHIHLLATDQSFSKLVKTHQTIEPDHTALAAMALQIRQNV